jgi:hypothetical protein
MRQAFGVLCSGDKNPAYLSPMGQCSGYFTQETRIPGTSVLRDKRLEYFAQGTKILGTRVPPVAKLGPDGAIAVFGLILFFH